MYGLNGVSFYHFLREHNHLIILTLYNLKNFPFIFIVGEENERPVYKRVEVFLTQGSLISDNYTGIQTLNTKGIFKEGVDTYIQLVLYSGRPPLSLTLSYLLGSSLRDV